MRAMSMKTCLTVLSPRKKHADAGVDSYKQTKIANKPPLLWPLEVTGYTGVFTAKIRIRNSC